MIKCDRESGVLVEGNIVECLAELGLVAEGIIDGAPEELRLYVAMDLANIIKTAIERTTKGGEENEKFKQST